MQENPILNFVGDIAIFRKYEEELIDPFAEIYLPQGDINIGNFEFPIPNNRAKSFYDTPDRYKVSYEYLKKLKLSRFNYLGFSNNHCMDYGLNGANDTISALNEKGVGVFGFSQNQMYSSVSFVCKGVSFCVLGVIKDGRWSKKKFGHGPDEYDVQKILKFIEDNKYCFDHVIIFPHWGTELVDVPPPNIIKDARTFIDAGSSAVIGHHPHVSQGIERYRNGLIAYSLGSFVYVHEEELGYQDGIKERFISICLSLEFDKESIKKAMPYYYHYDSFEKLPEIISNNRFDYYINYLNKNIHSKDLYYKKIRTVLLKRELKSFFVRLKIDPFHTIHFYMTYIIKLVLKKIIS